MTIINILDYIGIFVFAMSGLLAASEKNLDLFGGIIIAFVTAIGGGTIRDVLMDVEVAWIRSTTLIYMVLGGAITALIFKKSLKRIRKTMFLFDTIGITLFTIMGVQKAMLLDMPTFSVVFLGVIGATFGGVVRDILCNEIPLIFRQEIYATACLLGAVVYVGLVHFGYSEGISTLIAGSVIFSIRTISVVKKISLPGINDRI